MDKIKSPKSPKKYQCGSCDYTCSKQRDFNKYLVAGKYKWITRWITKSPRE